MTGSLLLHVGYHKTATTWMQQRLFHPEHGFQQLADHPEIFEHVVQPHGLHFDPKGMQDLIIQKLTSCAPGLVPVVSSEIMSGHHFLGGRESEVYAQRLAQIVEGLPGGANTKVLISIRNQLRILPSCYMQYVLRGGTMPYDLFFKGTNVPGYFAFDPRHFEYHHLVARYQRLFGAENVYVLPQESLQKDMEAAAADLARFVGAEQFQGLSEAATRVQSPSYPEYAAPMLRRINHVQTSTLNPTPIVSLGNTPYGLYKLFGYALKTPPLATVLKGKKPVSAYVRQQFKGVYDASNRHLADLITHPVDLNAYEGLSERLKQGL